MKLLSFLYNGQPGWGAQQGDEVAVLTGRWPDLAAALQAGPQAIAQALRGDAPRLPLAGLQYLPPIVAPGKILCVGLNYGRHVAETGRELPAHPSLFIRFADSLVGHQAEVWRPMASARFDFEGELAVVIGKAGRRIPAARALEHVAGYTCMAENSVRDFQKHSAQVTPGKNFARSGALGPWLATADEIPDPAVLQVVTRLNGEVMQDGRVDDLIFPIPELIAYISTFTPLAPGDIIATGTPEGVGARRTPPLFMAAGDVLEVDIPGVGRLVNPVADEPAACTEENPHG
ncbi:fumarylacetoacetate hydrolase family protein [Bordetella petrii]|uniref:fumarylacetoacetate hydrolase family protein n=1 Tax=Bordetella petrii TaxID=94624 RepID=UPI001A965CAA|nr:fumarylacetoacetate hydrolase family protein [Bordetella petrii]MBO1110386.1 fumarylacetoacetate hydrolase family protein [Bordetella petrii]